MHIIAHRGFWRIEAEKNTENAFRRALENGFGIETDFRDCAGKLVISHNPPRGDEMLAEDFFNFYTKYNSNVYLALNIKADGLQLEMKQLIDSYHITNYFVFDMSVCDTIGYINTGLNVFSRKSEFEHTIVFPDECKGIWYDMFDSKYYNAGEALNYFFHQKQVCLVSPELHGNEYLPMWQKYKELQNDNVMLCTDKPIEANRYFNGVLK
jgi:hypothetical protein